MRKIFTLSLSILLASCLSESNVDPGSSATFIRYFNGGNDDEAIGLETTPEGGYLILANTRVQKSEAVVPVYKIKLIKTDAAGNPLWTKLYPEFPSDPTVVTKDFAGSSIQRLDGGYVIAGYQIKQSDNTSKVLVMTVDNEGTLTDSLTFGTGSSKGQAVATNAAGNYLILSTEGATAMYLNEIDKTTFAPVGATPIEYEAGETTLARRLLVDADEKAVWSGKATKNGLTGIRVIRTIPNSVNVDFDLLFANPPFIEAGNDFCKYGQQYAIIGTTNTGVSGDSDILFKRISESGEVLSTQTFSFDNPATPEDEDQENDIGNSISTTQDGGVILLATVPSVNIGGRGERDFYLIKINAFGNTEWTSSFGSRFVDVGVAVRQASDGGYVTLGTTSQGSLNIICLMKTDKNGKIE